MSFLEGVHENEGQTEVWKLSEYPCRLAVVDYNFDRPLQNTCRNLSKEGLKTQFDSLLTENTKNAQVAPTTYIRETIEVVNYAMKKVNHALYLGEVLWKSEKGKLLYQRHNFNTTIESKLTILEFNL